MALVMGQTTVLVLLVLMSFVSTSLQASPPESDSYIAAVVEYAPVSGATLENKEEIFMQNVANYVCFMEEAAGQAADIIVFPEIGLASMGVPRNEDGTPSLAFYVPEPGSNPCDDNSADIAQGLRELSCAARSHGLYAVVNLPERVNCSECPCPGFPATADSDQCPPSGAYYHNTNVAFDRSGNIVARYRKFNLFGEPGFVPTQQPEMAMFDTDFGVRFGTFICFDIMFEKPAVALAKEHNICDFAFPTAWFSEAPFLTAVQTQAAWAYSLDVNLLAAGYNKPEVGSAGSGIFLGRGGTLQSVMPSSTTSQILVGAVPKMRRCKDDFASRSRTRRAIVSAKSATAIPEGEDEDMSVERTPLSAFHHIVHKRKYGHLDADVEDHFIDESAPAFIHHKMYEVEEGATDDDDGSQPPSGEYETKVPPHFMGLQQRDQVEDDDSRVAETQKTAGEDAREGARSSEKEETPHRMPVYGDEQKVDIPEKKIPASTSTDEYGFSEPSKNPDLLRLYHEEPKEQQLPDDFLEIEVPEIYERSFEPEHDQEYFKLPDDEEITRPSKKEDESRYVPPEEPDEQLLSTDGESTEAAGDTADLHVTVDEGTKETKETVGESVEKEVTEGEQVGTFEGERNATLEEIEASRKTFEWLIEDTDDSPEQEREAASNEEHIDDTDDVLMSGLAPKEEHIDDTDDVLTNDLPPKQEQIDDTDDVLTNGIGFHKPVDAKEVRVEENIDETDDILADDHGLHLLDECEKADGDTGTSPEQGGKDTEGLTEVHKGDSAGSDQSHEASGEPEKPCKCRKRSRRNRAKRNKQKCKQRPKEQEVETESSPEQPEEVVTTPEEQKLEEERLPVEPEGVLATPEEQELEEERLPVEPEGVITTPEEQQLSAGNEQPAEPENELEKPRKCHKHSLEDRAKQKERKCKPRPKEQKLEEGSSPEEFEGGVTTSEEQYTRSDPEVVGSEPKLPCTQRDRRESGGCPAFSEGVLDDSSDSTAADGLFLKRDHLDVYKTFTLTTDSLIENSTVLLCDGTFCCNFSVVMEVNTGYTMPRYAYRLAVFNGVRTFDDVATGGLQVCGVIPCSRDDMDSCGMLTLPDEAAYATVFRSISVSGIFSSNQTLVAANTVAPGLSALPADRFDLSSAPLGEGVARVSLRTSAAAREHGVSILAFAIYSRVFLRDGQPATTLPGAGGDPKR